MREACRGTFRVSPILDKPTSPPATAAPAEVLELAVAVAEKQDRETVAAWMIQEGFATGHADTLEDLLRELRWQIHDLRMKLQIP